MKKILSQFLFLILISIFLLSCSKDNSDNDNIVGTTWYGQEIVNLVDTSIEINYYVSFTTSTEGNLRSIFGENDSQTENFVYEYMEGQGTAISVENPNEIVEFKVLGDKMMFDDLILDLQ